MHMYTTIYDLRFTPFSVQLNCNIINMLMKIEDISGLAKI